MERYRKLSQDYEAEQERLRLEIDVTEEWVEQQEERTGGLDRFMALTRKYVDVPELTPTIVNEYINKIVVYPPSKVHGKRRQTVKIVFNFLDEVEIPAFEQSVTLERTSGRRKTA